MLIKVNAFCNRAFILFIFFLRVRESLSLRQPPPNLKTRSGKFTKLPPLAGFFMACGLYFPRNAWSAAEYSPKSLPGNFARSLSGHFPCYRPICSEVALFYREKPTFRATKPRVYSALKLNSLRAVTGIFLLHNRENFTRNMIIKNLFYTSCKHRG